MIQLIKIIFLFVLIWIFCQSIGLFLNDKLDLRFKKYYFSIGLITILCIYESLIIFPLLYNMSYIYSYISGIVVFIICLYTLYVERKQIINNIKDRKQLHILLIVCLTIVVFFISGNAANNFNDTYYYESFITENTKSSILNYINLFQSGYGFVEVEYIFDGYYHLLALLSNVFRINPYLLITWLMPFIYSVFYFSTCAELIEHFSFNFSKKYLILLIYIFVFAGLFKGFDLIYVGNFYNPLILSIIILIISKKDLSIKQSIFLMICFIAGISTQSSFIIYSIVIIIAKAFHIVINKNEKQISYMCLYMCPVVFFSILTFIKTFNIMSTFMLMDIIVLFVSILLSLLLNKILNVKRLKYCCILLSILIYCSSILLLVIGKYQYGPQDFFSTLDPFNVGYNFLNIIIEVIPLIIIVVKAFYSKNYNYYFALVIVTFLLFFNPLTIPSISTYMTSIVYVRIFNPCTAFIIFIFSLSLIKNIYSYILIVFFIINQCTFETKNISFYNKDTDNLLYRMSYDSVDAFNKLDELTKQYKEKTGFPPSTFATDLRSEFITYDAGYIFNLRTGRTMLTGDRLNYQSFREEQICDLYAALTKGDNFINTEYISSVISNQVIKFILIDSNQTDEAINEIEKNCILEYRNRSYLLYSCNQ